MKEIAKDGLKIFKIINSCKKMVQLEVADNCISQFQKKWLHKLKDGDEKLITFANGYADILKIQSSKIKTKLNVK